jgi:hypothetical protein
LPDKIRKTLARLAEARRRRRREILFRTLISIVLMTFKRPSDIYFLKAGEGSVGKGVGSLC